MACSNKDVWMMLLHHWVLEDQNSQAHQISPKVLSVPHRWIQHAHLNTCSPLPADKGYNYIHKMTDCFVSLKAKPIHVIMPRHSKPGSPGKWSATSIPMTWPILMVLPPPSDEWISFPTFSWSSALLQTRCGRHCCRNGSRNQFFPPHPLLG